MPAVFEYKEMVGVSSTSVEDAVQKAVDAVAVKSPVAWFEVASVRGRVLEGGALEYQVTVKAGCKA
jgi:flavin-binding protein dodecin